MSGGCDQRRVEGKHDHEEEQVRRHASKGRARMSDGQGKVGRRRPRGELEGALFGSAMAGASAIAGLALFGRSSLDVVLDRSHLLDHWCRVVSEV